MTLDIATTHTQADPDGLGGLLALRLLYGPLELALPAGMNPVARQIWADHADALPPLVSEGELRRRLASEPLGRMLVADACRADRLGWLGDYVDRFERVEAFDTHPAGPDDLPRASLPDAGAATSPLVVALAEAGITPSPVEAGVMLVGIHEDTGHFTFPGTTEVDHRAAGLCLAWGANARWPGRYAPRGYTTHQLQLLEAMARRVRRLSVAGLELALIELETTEYEPDLSDLLTQLREAEAWPAAVLLCSSGGRVQVIARSDGSVDVSALCAALGGGGHSEAAAASLDGVGLAEARAMAEAAARATLSAARQVSELAIEAWISLPVDRTIAEAADLLHAHRINGVPLVRGDGAQLEVVGQITRREVEEALRHGMGDAPAESISARRPPEIAPDAPLIEAQRAFSRHGGRLMMVAREGQPPHALLTRTGLLMELAAQVDPPRRERPPPARIMLGLLRKHLGAAWPSARAAGEMGAARGCPVYLVGGAVRDLLLEHAIEDVDLVVEGDAVALARALAREHGGHVTEHAAFGTAKWHTEGGATIDLARARAEVYPARAQLPQVLHAALHRDLGRRDFTLNAMATSLAPGSVGELVDPHGGYADLKAGRLRVLHGLSFHDDPTRAFRAARFTGRFGFALAEDTASLLRAALRAGALEHLGRERLGAELDRLLAERAVAACLGNLDEWGLLSAVHPRLRLSGDRLDDVHRIAGATRELRGMRGEGWTVRQADALWVWVGQGVPEADREAMRRMVPGARDRQDSFVLGPERVAKALHWVGRSRRPSGAARNLAGLSPVEQTVVLALARAPHAADRVRWFLREGYAIAPALDGHRLLAEGVPRGPLLGKALAAAQSAAWDGADAAAQLQAALAAAGKGPVAS